MLPPGGSTEHGLCSLSRAGQKGGYPAASYPRNGLSHHALVALAWIDAFTTWDLSRLYSHVTPYAGDFRYEYRPRTMHMPTKTLEDWQAYTRRLMQMLPDFWVRYSPLLYQRRHTVLSGSVPGLRKGCWWHTLRQGLFQFWRIDFFFSQFAGEWFQI
jgi:hypothetical protein